MLQLPTAPRPTAINRAPLKKPSAPPSPGGPLVALSAFPPDIAAAAHLIATVRARRLAGGVAEQNGAENISRAPSTAPLAARRKARTVRLTADTGSQQDAA